MSNLSYYLQYSTAERFHLLPAMIWFRLAVDKGDQSGGVMVVTMGKYHKAAAAIRNEHRRK